MGDQLNKSRSNEKSGVKFSVTQKSLSTDASASSLSVISPPSKMLSSLAFGSDIFSTLRILEESSADTALLPEMSTIRLAAACTVLEKLIDNAPSIADALAPFCTVLFSVIFVPNTPKFHVLLKGVFKKIKVSRELSQKFSAIMSPYFRKTYMDALGYITEELESCERAQRLIARRKGNNSILFSRVYNRFALAWTRICFCSWVARLRADRAWQDQRCTQFILFRELRLRRWAIANWTTEARRCRRSVLESQVMGSQLSKVRTETQSLISNVKSSEEEVKKLAEEISVLEETRLTLYNSIPKLDENFIELRSQASSLSRCGTQLLDSVIVNADAPEAPDHFFEAAVAWADSITHGVSMRWLLEPARQSCDFSLTSLLTLINILNNTSCDSSKDSSDISRSREKESEDLVRFFSIFAGTPCAPVRAADLARGSCAAVLLYIATLMRIYFDISFPKPNFKALENRRIEFLGTRAAISDKEQLDTCDWSMRLTHHRQWMSKAIIAVHEAIVLYLPRPARVFVNRVPTQQLVETPARTAQITSNQYDPFSPITFVRQVEKENIAANHLQRRPLPLGGSFGQPAETEIHTLLTAAGAGPEIIDAFMLNLRSNCVEYLERIYRKYTLIGEQEEPAAGELHAEDLANILKICKLLVEQPTEGKPTMGLSRDEFYAIITITIYERPTSDNIPSAREVSGARIQPPFFTEILTRVALLVWRRNGVGEQSYLDPRFLFEFLTEIVAPAALVPRTLISKAVSRYNISLGYICHCSSGAAFDPLQIFEVPALRRPLGRHRSALHRVFISSATSSNQLFISLEGWMTQLVDWGILTSCSDRLRAARIRRAAEKCFSNSFIYEESKQENALGEFEWMAAICCLATIYNPCIAISVEKRLDAFLVKIL